jgi:hypothetical protein
MFLTFCQFFSRQGGSSYETASSILKNTKSNMAATRFGSLPGMAGNMAGVQQQMMSQRPQQFNQGHFQAVSEFKIKFEPNTSVFFFK